MEYYKSTLGEMWAVQFSLIMREKFGNKCKERMNYYSFFNDEKIKKKDQLWIFLAARLDTWKLYQ